MKANEAHLWSDQMLIRLIEGSNAIGEPKYFARMNRRVFESRLATTAQFSVKLAATGSYTRGTHVHFFSDWDYFLPLPGEFSHRSVHEVFIDIASALDAITDRSVSIEIDWPALVIKTSSESEVFDIVPMIKKSNYVLMSNNVGSEWMKAQPKNHNEFLQRQYSRDADFRYFARLLKAWNYSNGRPFVSIFLELFVCDHLLHITHPSLIVGFQRIVESLIRGKFGEPDYGQSNSLMNVDALHGGFANKRTVTDILEVSKDGAFRAEQLEKSGDLIGMQHEMDKILPLAGRKVVGLPNYRYVSDGKRIRKIVY